MFERPIIVFILKSSGTINTPREVVCVYIP